MATQTPLNHPDEAAQVEQFFRWRAAIRRSNRDGALAPVSGLQALKAAYGPELGGDPQMFQGEGTAGDRLLILGWYPAIRPKDELSLTRPDGSPEGDFIVEDRIPYFGMTRTLLTLSPSNSQ